VSSFILLFCFLQFFYLCGWIVAAGLGIAVVYGPYTAVHDHAWGEAETVIYGMFFRVVWAIALCWVIYASHNGYGGLFIFRLF